MNVPRVPTLVPAVERPGGPRVRAGEGRLGSGLWSSVGGSVEGSEVRYLPATPKAPKEVRVLGAGAGPLEQAPPKALGRLYPPRPTPPRPAGPRVGRRPGRVVGPRWALRAPCPNRLRVLLLLP